MTLALVIALALILANALYVAAEFAVLGTRVTQVQQLTVEGHQGARRLLPVVSDTARLDTFIAVCQIGITVTSLVLGAFGQATFAIALGDALIHSAGLDTASARSLAALAVLVALTSTQVVFGELIPKTIALQFPLRTALATFVPLRWSHVLFAPFLPLLNGSGGWVLRRMGVAGDRSHRHVHAPEEIEMLVRESREGGQIEEGQRVRLQRTLRLSRRSVRQVMVPRRRIAAVDRSAPAGELLDAVSGSPYTRLIVQRGSLEQVDGYLHTKDLVRALARGRTIEQLPDLVRPLTRVLSTCTLDDALAQLRKRRSRVALVVDSLGEIEGLISIEDVMRELVGALSDEFKRDVGPLAPAQLEPGVWRMPGRLALDELTEWARAEHIDPVWSDSAVETLAGWLIERVGLLPQLGQRIAVGALEFTIERLDGVAIEAVRVERFTDAGESNDG